MRRRDFVQVSATAAGGRALTREPSGARTVTGAKAPPDGYTLLMSANSLLTVNPHVYMRTVLSRAGAKSSSWRVNVLNRRMDFSATPDVAGAMSRTRPEAGVWLRTNGRCSEPGSRARDRSA